MTGQKEVSRNAAAGKRGGVGQQMDFLDQHHPSRRFY